MIRTLVAFKARNGYRDGVGFEFKDVGHGEQGVYFYLQVDEV